MLLMYLLVPLLSGLQPHLLGLDFGRFTGDILTFFLLGDETILPLLVRTGLRGEGVGLRGMVTDILGVGIF